MAAPTLSDYQQSNWTDNSTGSEVTASASWSAGDWILVAGATEDSAFPLNLPTATGLSFSQIGTTAGASNTVVFFWAAQAGSGGSGAITATNPDGWAKSRGLSVWVWSACNGFGTPQSIAGTNASVISLTRTQANSCVVTVMADWSQAGDVTVTPSPVGGTQRVAVAVAGKADFFVFDFPDQGATGTSNYGHTAGAATVDMNGLAVEVLGLPGVTDQLISFQSDAFQVGVSVNGAATPTRIYLPSTGAAPGSPAFGAWNRTDQADRLRAVLTRISSSMTTIQREEETTTEEQYVLARQYLLGPLNATTLTAGTLVTGQVRVSEASGNLNAQLAIRLAVCDSAFSSVTQVLPLTSNQDPGTPATPPEFATAALTSRPFQTPFGGPSTTDIPIPSDVSLPQGGYLIIEIGFYERSLGLRLADFSFGDNSGTDLTAGSTAETTANNPWVQLSQTLTLASGATDYPITSTSGTYAITGTAAGLQVGRKVGATAGAYSISGSAVGLKAGLKVTAASGSYAISGTSAGLIAARKIAAVSGSYAVTGTAAGLRRGFTAVATSGAYSVTGTAVGLQPARKVVATSGAYAVTGSTAVLRAARTLATASGSYAITGSAAALRRGFAVGATSGAYAITGSAATLRRTWGILAASGTYSVTGSTVGLRYGRTLTATAGAYALTGSTVGLRLGRKATATSGVYAVTGTAAALVRGRPVSAVAGVYTITGSTVGLRFGGRVAATSGAYAITGTAANLVYSTFKTLAASSGVYAISGTDVALRTARKQPTVSGTYALTGTPVGLAVGRKVAAVAGSYAVTGTAVTFALVRKVTATSGVYSLTGSTALLRATRRLTAASGAYTVTGTPVTLQAARSLLVDAGSVTISGTAAALVVARRLNATAGSVTIVGTDALLSGGASAGPAPAIRRLEAAAINRRLAATVAGVRRLTPTALSRRQETAA